MHIKQIFEIKETFREKMQIFPSRSSAGGLVLFGLMWWTLHVEFVGAKKEWGINAPLSRVKTIQSDLKCANYLTTFPTLV